MKKNCKRRRSSYFWLASAVFSTCLSIIPVRLAIAYYQTPVPQAIFTLGGGMEREKFTAQFAKKHPSLKIWISSGIPSRHSQQIFRSANIPDSRVHLDCHAIDTVTNFTSLVAEFQEQNIRHLYLITSDYHMARAQAIAFFVFGTKGIAVTPISIPSDNPSESWLHVLRDSTRAILWIFTGRTGASFNPQQVSPCVW